MGPNYVFIETGADEMFYSGVEALVPKETLLVPE